MSDQTQTTQSTSTIDPYERLMITPNSDGTFTRRPINQLYPDTPATPDPTLPTPVLSKDIPINQSTSTWARVFLPRDAIDTSSTPNQKLPLIIYIHGGGFVISSAATNICHDFCFNMAVDLPAVVFSVEYRLAPEHRLPAAYDDCLEALLWFKTTNEAWLRNYADFNNCFLMGTSAGGNIAYHVGLRAAGAVDNLTPLKIKGLILHHPFFGGSQRNEDEVRLANDPVLPQVCTDVSWELSLPIGADRDHEFCNPTVGGGSKMLEKIGLVGWRVLVSGVDGDPLIGRERELVELMKEKGIIVESNFTEGDCHGVEILYPSKAKALYVVLKNFMLSCGAN